MPVVVLYNLGCSKNLVDGERILHLFTNAGYSVGEDASDADVIVVNTCAFIREAQEEAIETILTAARFKSSTAQLIVSGCFSQRFREKTAGRFPEVNLWAGVDDWEDLIGRLVGVKAPSSFERVLSEPFSTQYLKIAEGCSHRCSFCVIPAIRGPYRSRTVQSVADEAKWLESNGVRELILVAQDTSYYGKDQGISLTVLLEKLLSECSIPWIRCMYLHPLHVIPELLELIAAESRICPYFDIPLQHIADPLLRSMKRRPLSREIHRLIECIRSTVPGAALRSSFIVGYPGETETHFKELLKFIEWARFEKLGVFPYSPEHGTAAAGFRPRPRNSTAQRRCETLMLAQREISREINESLVGTVMEVIVDRIAEDPDFNFEARSKSDAPEVDGNVLLRDGDFTPGTITRVRIIGASDYDLIAETL